MPALPFEEFHKLPSKPGKIAPYKEWVPEHGYDVLYKGSMFTLLRVNTPESMKNITLGITAWNFDDQATFNALDAGGALYLICSSESLEPRYYFHQGQKHFRDVDGNPAIAEGDFWGLFGDRAFLTAFTDLLKFGRTTGPFDGF